MKKSMFIAVTIIVCMLTACGKKEETIAETVDATTIEETVIEEKVTEELDHTEEVVDKPEEVDKSILAIIDVDPDKNREDALRDDSYVDDMTDTTLFDKYGRSMTSKDIDYGSIYLCFAKAHYTGSTMKNAEYGYWDGDTFVPLLSGIDPFYSIYHGTAKNDFFNTLIEHYADDCMVDIFGDYDPNPFYFMQAMCYAVSDPKCAGSGSDYFVQYDPDLLFPMGVSERADGNPTWWETADSYFTVLKAPGFFTMMQLANNQDDYPDYYVNTDNLVFGRWQKITNKERWLEVGWNATEAIDPSSIIFFADKETNRVGWALLNDDLQCIGFRFEPKEDYKMPDKYFEIESK